MYAITHTYRGRTVIERRYTTAKHINPVQKLIRKVFTQDNLLCVLLILVSVQMIVSNI